MLEDDFDKPRLYGVKSTHVDMVWEEVLPFINDSIAFSDGKYKAEDVLTNIEHQNMQLWVIYAGDSMVGCCVTQILCYPQEKRLGILFYGGVGIDEWLHLINLIFEFGKEHGCKSCEIFGRPAWEKKLKEHGFEKIHIVLKKEL